jgi:membrane-associated protein
MEVLEFIKNLADAEFIVNWGSLFFLVALVFAECTLLIGFVLPGNSLIFVAGASCSMNPNLINTNVYFLILLLSIAAFLGYYFGYYFGLKKMGPKCLKPNTKIFIFKQKSIDITTQFYNYHGGKTLVIGRFLPLIRNFAPVIAGMIKMDSKKYILYNAIGALIWTGSLSLTGYYLGTQRFVADYLDFVFIGILTAISFSFYFAYQIKNRD